MKVLVKIKWIKLSFFVLGITACKTTSLYKVEVEQTKRLPILKIAEINTSLNYFGDYKFYDSINSKVDRKEFKTLIHLFNKDIASDSVFIFKSKTYIPPFFTHFLLKLKDGHHLPLHKMFNLPSSVNDFFYVFKANGSFFLLAQIAKNKNTEGKEVAQREFNEIMKTITTN